jgi:hypothetical protein
MKLNEALPTKHTPQGSGPQQLQAYYSLRTARRLVAASLISGKQEFRSAISQMKGKVDSRKKNNDGKIYDEMDVQSIEQQQTLWVGATTRQLKALAEFEVEMLSVITNRGLVPTEDALEALEFMAA